MSDLVLVSHTLCPYVQRAVIALTEKGVPFERRYVDLSNKPRWFIEISPLGRTPVLVARGVPIFESAVILEYLEETEALPLHPAEPLARARHRAWIEFGSAILSDIAGFYGAKDSVAFDARAQSLSQRFARLEAELAQGPFFDGARFSLVDAVFGPIFRYFDTFDVIGDFASFGGKPRLAAWRTALAARASVRDAVTDDYPVRLRRFLLAKDSHLSRLMEAQEAV